MGKAVKDTSVDSSKAFAQLISPKHNLFNLNKFQTRIEQHLPYQQGAELQNVTSHPEDCRNTEESHLSELIVPNRDVYSSILLTRGGRGKVLGSGKNIGVFGLFLARN